jgi:hypothetical protein
MSGSIACWRRRNHGCPAGSALPRGRFASSSWRCRRCAAQRTSSTPAAPATSEPSELVGCGLLAVERGAVDRVRLRPFRRCGLPPGSERVHTEGRRVAPGGIWIWIFPAKRGRGRFHGRRPGRRARRVQAAPERDQERPQRPAAAVVTRRGRRGFADRCARESGPRHVLGGAADMVGWKERCHLGVGSRVRFAWVGRVRRWPMTTALSSASRLGFRLRLRQYGGLSGARGERRATAARGRGRSRAGWT